MNYQDYYKKSLQDPEGFWGNEAKRIDWHTPFKKVLDYSKPPFANWFIGGETNLCHNAVDRWASKQPDTTALIAISTETADGTPSEKSWTFKELQAEIERTAAIMQSRTRTQKPRRTLNKP
jgi:propionyl-CoA synthetase